MEYEVKWNCPTMDDWQKPILTIKHNMIIMCGRQTGKSEIIAKKLADYLLNNPDKHILIVSGVERQASGLYIKTLRNIEANYPRELKKGKDKPLRTVFKLKNGSILRTEPVGMDGSGARQHTIDGVVFEEMQLIPEEAYAAITPMLLTTGGFIWMLGTAWATEGYAYERLKDPDFKVFMVNSEEVAELRPEPQRTIMKGFLEKEKKRLSAALYAQEYLAIPQENLRRLFPDSLLKECLVLSRKDTKTGRFYLGIDVAAMGEDLSSFEIIEKKKDNYNQIESTTTRRTYTTETFAEILRLEREYKFRRIGIDDGGVGFGVFSQLLQEPGVKKKVIALNNASRPLDKDETKKKRLLKEDMYFNLLSLMEHKRINLLNDNEIKESLASVQWELVIKEGTPTRTHIFGRNTHIAEGIIRAVWLASQDKSLNIWAR